MCDVTTHNPTIHLFPFFITSSIITKTHIKNLLLLLSSNMIRLATSTAISRRLVNGSLRFPTTSRSSEYITAPLLLSHRYANHLLDSLRCLPTIRNFSARDNTLAAKYQCVHVFVSVKPGKEQEFLTATLANARASSQEPGIARFDVLQQGDDPTKFVLVEVYKNADAPGAHKHTSHYKIWRESVENMMAEPRRAIKYNNHFPSTVGGWDYGDDIRLE